MKHRTTNSPIPKIDKQVLKKTIDLSHLISTGMPVYPGTEAPVLESACTVNNQGFAELKISMFSHVGTHLDTPAHLFADGKSLSNLAVDHFFGKAILVRYSSRHELSIQRIDHLIKEFGKPDFFLFSCGWDQYWGLPEYFSDFPVPSSSFCEYLTSLNIKGIGIDAISIDRVEDSNLPNHKILLSKEIIIVENLTDLDKLPDIPVEFFCLPLKLENGDGSPVRAIAQF